MKKLFTTTFVAIICASFAQAITITTLEVPVATSNTDFTLGANPQSLTTLPVSGSQSGGSYTITTATVNAVATVSSGSTATPSFSLAITNNTGFEATALTLSGFVLQFKDNSGNNNETLTASVTGATFGATPFNITLVANDGGATSTPNDPPLSKPYFATVSGFSLASGSTLTLTWTDANDGGTDAMFGLSGVNVSLSAIPEPSTYAMLVGAGGLFFLVMRRRRAA